MSLRYISTSLLFILACFTGLAFADAYEKALMPGEVIQDHAKYELDCDKCHRRFDKSAQPKLCADCHKGIAADIGSKTRMHGRLEGKVCRDCHVEHKGRNAKIAAIDKEKFDHGRTDFPLKGAHQETRVKCTDCHAAKVKYRDAPKLCNDCHRKDDQAKGHKGKLGAKCESCHGEKNWKEVKFDHEKTKFPLLGGKHADVKCKECHADKTYQQTPLTCNGCHAKDDEKKGHRGKLGTKCESCHGDKSWKEVKFDHEKTKFSLLGGKHAQVKCNDCHTDKTYQRTPLTCNGCHSKDDEKKGHKGNYGSKCESCHNDRGWKELRFNHDTDTHYPLRDKHRQVKCNACHLPEMGSLYKQKLPEKCIACHKKDEQQKGHRSSLGDKCESCHNERGWKGSSFNHDKTQFPLRDKHKDAKCDTCHKGGVAGPNARIKVEKECVACHRKDDQEKGHKGRYGNKCESCHNEKNWKTITFDHDRDTKYKLKDKHRQAKCDTCHSPEKGSLYQQKKLDSQCISCHKKDDKHKNQLGNKCESCHNEKRWQDAPYDHNKSRFPLTGSHVKAECKKCHATPAYRDASSSCNACHEKEDKHKRRFGTKCETCHYTGTWKSWDFDHGSTRFILDGGHKKADCYDCHLEPTSRQSKTSKACVSCHLKEDVHSGGFGGQCERCHVTDNWKKVRR